MTRTIALALATLALLPAVASAAAGDPDPSFDSDGKRMLPQPYTANEVLVQPDGKIIVVGNGGPANDFVITRLLADGSHDRSFDGDGTAIVDFEGQDQANAAALQPDGTIVVAGERTIEADDDLAVVRLLPTGKPDTTFGPSGDGKAVIDEPTAPSDAVAVLVRPDGRIVIPGPGYSDEQLRHGGRAADEPRRARRHHMGPWQLRRRPGAPARRGPRARRRARRRRHALSRAGADRDRRGALPARRQARRDVRRDRQGHSADRRAGGGRVGARAARRQGRGRRHDRRDHHADDR